MELSPEQLINRPSSKSLSPIYLIAGPEMIRVIEAADSIRALACKQQGYERCLYDVDSRDFDWEQVAQAFHTQSLFSPRRLIELRLSTGQLGKEGSAVIQAFCQAPTAQVIVMITSFQWSKAHKTSWVDAISSIGVIAIAWPIKPHELPTWVGERLRRKGISADQDAIAHLCARIEGNLLAAAQDIDQLVLLSDGQPLQTAQIKEWVAQAARYDVFRLVEMAFNGQTPHMRLAIAGLRAEGCQVAALMPVIVKDLWRAVCLAQAHYEKKNIAAVMKAQGIWAARQASFQRAMARHPNYTTWESFLVTAGHIDRIVKGRAPGNGWRALERLLLQIAQPKTHYWNERNALVGL